MGVDFLLQEPARIVGDPFTAHVPGEVTQESRMTNVPVRFWRSHLGIVVVEFLPQAPT